MDNVLLKQKILMEKPTSKLNKHKNLFIMYFQIKMISPKLKSNSSMMPLTIIYTNFKAQFSMAQMKLFQ
jgi:hypothetical protein